MRTIADTLTRQAAGRVTTERVRRAKRLYPESFRRVRGACVHASALVDLDDHAARIVLAVKEGAR